MLEDPPGTPTATGQIDGTRLGEPHAMAEATTLETPDLFTLRFDHKQGARQAPQRAADGMLQD